MRTIPRATAEVLLMSYNTGERTTVGGYTPVDVHRQGTGRMSRLYMLVLDDGQGRYWGAEYEMPAVYSAGNQDVEPFTDPVQLVELKAVVRTEVDYVPV